MNDIEKTKIIKGLPAKTLYRRIGFFSMIIFILVIFSICFIKSVKWIDKPFSGFLVNERIAVQSIGLYQWTGMKVGLKFPDKILKVNDQDVSSASEFEKMAESSEIGTSINYLVARNGKKFEVIISTMLFDIVDFLAIFGVFFFVGIAYLLIGVVVFVLKPNTNASWAFLLLCFFLSIFQITNVDLIALHTVFTRFYLFGHAFVPAACIHLSMYFPEQNKFIQKRSYLQFCPYIISLMLVVPNEILYPDPKSLLFGGMAYIYTLIGVIVLLVAIFSSYLKRTSVIARQRAKVVLFGTALAFPIPATLYFMHFFGKQLLGLDIKNNFYVLPILLFPAAIAYSIARHNLFDVDVFLKRTIGFIITTIIVGSVFLLMHVTVDIFVHHQVVGDHHGSEHHELVEVDVSVDHTLVKGAASEHQELAEGNVSVGQELVKGAASEHHDLGQSNAHVKSLWSKLNIGDKIVPVLSALLIVFCFNPLHHSVQHLVDRLFYREKYDYKKTITSISHTLNSMLDETSIIKQLVSTVRKEMFVDTVGVILLEPQSKSLQTLFMDNETDKIKDHKKDVHIAYDDPLLALLSKEKKMITKYDIAEAPHYSYVKESCGKIFLEMESSLAIPLIYKDQVKGVFSIGHKKSGHFFTSEDIDLLKTLGNHGIVAIENAKLFEENLDKVRMEEELKIGHEIQMSMLPDKTPEIEGFEIAAKSIPAREVGGDFYDFVETGEGGECGSQAIVVGDVSGKGVSAALLMAASMSTYRALAADNHSVEKVMAIGNQRLNNDVKKGMFVALLYAVLTPGERVLTFSNAGQTQPILCSEEGAKPAFIDTDGDKFPQGIVPDCQYLEKQVKLKEGNAVVLYTDGVVEAMNKKDELYGFERFISSIDEGRALDANSLLEKLMNDVMLFAEGAKQHDDITIIVIKVV